MIPLKVISTDKFDLGTDPVELAASTRARIVRVHPTVNVHVAIAKDATVNDHPVPERAESALFHLDPNEKVSVIKAVGEPSGTVWISVVKVLGV